MSPFHEWLLTWPAWLVATFGFGTIALEWWIIWHMIRHMWRETRRRCDSDE